MNDPHLIQTYKIDTIRNKFFFFVFLAAYASFLLINPQLGPIDDHTFLDTIEIGKPLPFFINPENGRFYPLDAQEYNIVAKLFPVTPLLYWAVNAFQLILFALICFRVLRFTTNNTTLIYTTLFLLFLSPGFTLAWSRFQIPERGVIFCLSVFINCYFVCLREQSRKKFLLVGLIGVVFANFALYYKETVFLALSSFSFDIFVEIIRLENQAFRWPIATQLSNLCGCLFFYCLLKYFGKLCQLSPSILAGT